MGELSGWPATARRPTPPALRSRATPGARLSRERPGGRGEPGTHLQQHGQQEAQVHLVEAHLAHRLERLLHLHGGLATEDRAATATEDLAARWTKIGRRRDGGLGRVGTEGQAAGTGREDRADRSRGGDRGLGRAGAGGPGGAGAQAQAGPCSGPGPGRGGDARLVAPARPPRFLSEVTGIFGERLAGARKGRRKWVRRGRPRRLTGGAGSSTPRPAGFAPSHKAVECGGAQNSRAFRGEGREASVPFLLCPALGTGSDVSSAPQDTHLEKCPQGPRTRNKGQGQGVMVARVCQWSLAEAWRGVGTDY